MLVKECGLVDNLFETDGKHDKGEGVDGLATGFFNRDTKRLPQELFFFIINFCSFVF